MKKYQVFWNLQKNIFQGQRKKIAKDIIKVPWKKPINLVCDEQKHSFNVGINFRSTGFCLVSSPICVTIMPCTPFFCLGPPKGRTRALKERLIKDYPLQAMSYARYSSIRPKISWKNEGTKVVGMGGHKWEYPICAGVNDTQGIWCTRKWKRVTDFNTSCYGLRNLDRQA